jgi:wyosine [tRNA(Phe)-imidazoG37] synthetase (radical SAM superfamily)
MYPHINQMLKELHDRRISSFLVTNAQFPDRIAQLDPVTQLYVSVDASTRESLKAIDRPLFKDFWEVHTHIQLNDIYVHAHNTYIHTYIHNVHVNPPSAF